MNISVSNGLRKRMDAFKQDVNWSALACRAFEEHLAQNDARRIEDMEDVISRLNSTIGNHTDEYKYGFEDGSEWAKEKATVAELQRIERARVPDYDWNFDKKSGPSNARRLYFIIDPGPGKDYSDADAFWEAVLSYADNADSANDRDYIQGFAEGAMDVWNQVKSKVC